MSDAVFTPELFEERLQEARRSYKLNLGYVQLQAYCACMTYLGSNGDVLASSVPALG